MIRVSKQRRADLNKRLKELEEKDCHTQWEDIERQEQIDRIMKILRQGHL